MTVEEPKSPWEHLLPLSGAAYAGLMVLGAIAFPMPPGGDVSPASNPGWLAANYNEIVAQSYVRALGAVAFIVLSAAAATACRRSLGGRPSLPTAALVGGALCGALLLLAQAAGLAAALFAHAGGGPDAIRALGALQNAFLDLSSLPAVVLFAAVGVTAAQTELLPRWLTVVTLLGVPFALLDAASYDGGPFEAVGFVGLIYFLAWSLLVGVRLYIGQRTTTAAATAKESATSATGGVA